MQDKGWKCRKVNYDNDSEWILSMRKTHIRASTLLILSYPISASWHFCFGRWLISSGEILLTLFTFSFSSLASFCLRWENEKAGLKEAQKNREKGDLSWKINTSLVGELWR